MNIPQDTLQAIADAAFAATQDKYHDSLVYKQDHELWEHESPARRAVIQHALENPALAPFLAGGIRGYTDEEIKEAWAEADKANYTWQSHLWQRTRAFLAALPRRKNPDLAQAIARAEKAEADVAVNYGMLLAARERAEKAENLVTELENKLAEIAAGCDIQRGDLLYRQRLVVIGTGKTEDAIRAEKAEKELASLKGDMLIAERVVDNVKRILPELVKSPSWEDAATSVREHIDKLQNELAALKSSQLGILRPLSDMPETVPEGCVRMTGWKNADGIWSIGPNKESFDTHFAILRLPAAEGAPPAEPEPEPAAQVPLGPEDCPPGSVIFVKGTDIQAMVVRVCDSGMWIYGITGHAYEVCFQEAFYDWQINTSIPDTGRWDANAWRDCSKPGKEVAK